MRVYIAPCGIGLGHAGQMLCVARELKGEEILFSSYGRAVTYLRKEGYEVFESPSIGWHENEGVPDATATMFGLIPSFVRAARQIFAEMRAIRKFDPDFVLSDGRYSTVAAARKLRIPFALVTHQITFSFPEMPMRRFAEWSVTGLNRLYLPGKKILVPDLPPPDTIGDESMRKTEGLDMEYVGFVVRPSPPSLPSPADAKAALGFGSAPLVYAALSGAGERLISSITDGLDKTGFESLVVLGRPDSKATRNVGMVRIVPWLERRELALRAADVIITRGGHRTLSEVAAHGKPALVIPQARQPEQEINAKGFARLGSGITLDESAASSDAIADAIVRLMADDKYVRAARSLAAKSEGMDGAARIAQYVREHARR